MTRAASITERMDRLEASHDEMKGQIAGIKYQMNEMKGRMGEMEASLAEISRLLWKKQMGEIRANLAMISKATGDPPTENQSTTGMPQDKEATTVMPVTVQPKGELTQKVAPMPTLPAFEGENRAEQQLELISFPPERHCVYASAQKDPRSKLTNKGGVVVVDAPGQLNGILEMIWISPHQVSYFVVDEAEWMSDRGFKPRIRKILKEVPARRQPLIFTVECYIRYCWDINDGWGKVTCLHMNSDCIALHVQNLLSSFTIVIKNIETIVKISGVDLDNMHYRRAALLHKYDDESVDPQFFWWKFGKQFIIPREVCNRHETVWKENRLLFLEEAREEKASSRTENEKFAELLLRKLNAIVTSMKVMELMRKDFGSYVKEYSGLRNRVPFSIPVVADIRLKIARALEVLDELNQGKFIVGYVPTCGVKEYYIGSACEELYAPPSAYVGLYGFLVQASFLGGVLEKVGVEAQVERCGKYKTFGDQFTCKSMSDENREMLTSLLDNIYRNWLEKISQSKGKKKEDIENFINEGVHRVERMKEEGFITDIKYEDEVMSLLRARLGIPCTRKLPTVGYRKYCNVKKSTLGLSSSKDLIAIIRASGSISRTQGRFNAPSSRVIADQFIDKIRRVRGSKRFKAAIIRIDSPGGDALASDLMWREIKLLAAAKPVVASMSDVAASGGYYMAMAADAIVAETLTLTGSIGVVTGKLNLGKLYEFIGFNKEIISRGRYAEIVAAENRPFRADEAELFSQRVQEMYEQFRDKAAFSRSMTVEKMERAAQGRVWAGIDAASLGLVDAIGGLSRAIAIAKQKANIPLDREVTLVELSRAPSPLKRILGAGNTFADEAVIDLIHEMAHSDAIQARMDGILLEKFEGDSYVNSILMLLKHYFRST